MSSKAVVLLTKLKQKMVIEVAPVHMKELPLNWNGIYTMGQRYVLFQERPRQSYIGVFGTPSNSRVRICSVRSKKQRSRFFQSKSPRQRAIFR